MNDIFHIIRKTNVIKTHIIDDFELTHSEKLNKNSYI